MKTVFRKIINQIKFWWNANTTSARIGTILLVLICLGLSIGFMGVMLKPKQVEKRGWQVAQPDKSAGMDKKVEQRYIAIIKDKDRLIKKLKIGNEFLKNKDVIAETKIKVNEDTGSVRVVATIDDKGEGGLIVKEEKAVVRLIPSIFASADYLALKSSNLGDWRFSTGIKGVKLGPIELRLKGEVDTRNNWAVMGTLEYTHRLGE